jgi:hypothetical protein
LADHPTEKQFVKGFHQKKFKNLPSHLQKFIILLNNNSPLDDDCVITCFDKTESVPPHADYKLIVHNKKQKPLRDVEIKFKQKVKKVSLKSGNGISTHQIIWSKWKNLLEHFNATEKEIEAFNNFLHSRDTKYFKEDGEECEKYNFTKDHPEFNDNHSNQKKIMQKFFDKNEEQLLEHFLKKGWGSEEGWAEYVFHGKKDDILSDSKFGKMDSWIKDIIKTSRQERETSSRGPALYLGVCTVQRWNVCPESKYKLNSIQAKIDRAMKMLK